MIITRQRRPPQFQHQCGDLNSSHLEAGAEVGHQISCFHGNKYIGVCFSVDVVAGKQKAHAKKMMKKVNDDVDDVAINLIWRTG